MTVSSSARYVAVVGPGSEAVTEDLEAAAAAVGSALARGGAVMVCGGLGGRHRRRSRWWEAASRGASEAGGVVVGLLPGADRSAGNRFLTAAIATGMGELRNGLVVRSADAVIAIGGAYGTLSEIALALKLSRPVIGIGTWAIDGVVGASDPAHAVALALR